MTERNSDRWVSLTQSVVLHATVVALLGYGWWTFRKHTPPVAASDELAIEAVAIQAPSKGKAKPQPQPEPPKPEPLPPEPEAEPDSGPPTPTPEQIAQRAELEHKQQEQKQEAEQQAIEVKRQADEKREADAKAAADRKSKEEAAAKKEAEQKRLADQRRKEDDARKLAEARVREQREAELRQSLQQEDRLNQLRSSSAMSSWVSQITGRIQRAWLRPDSARPGIDCVVYVTQVPGGEVVNVRVGSCNGDDALRQSIEAAVYRASPLPQPSDPALFERNLEIRFRPVD